MWSSRTGPCVAGGNALLDADPPGGGAQALPEPRVRVRPRAGCARLLVAHEVEQHHRARVAERRRRDLAAAQPVALEVAVGERRAGVSSPSKKMNWIVCRGRRDRARELRHHRGARGAVVRAHEAGDVLRVVVGADARRSPARGRAPSRSRCAGRPAPPGSARAARSASGARASRRDSGEPAGRGPSSTWLAQQAERRGAVEAVHGRRGRRARAAVRLAVVDEREVVRGHEGHEREAERHLYREHDSQQLHRADCGE